MAGFLDALKRSLKAKGLTYRDLVQGFELSEASVKRIFAKGTLSLEQVEIVLDALEMTLLDVAKLARPAADERHVLSFEQESVLASDARLFTVFHFLLFGATVDEIVGSYEISAKEAGRHLRVLIDLGLAREGKSGDVKMLKSRTIKWRDKGPLRAAYGDRIRADFLAQPFAAEREVVLFRTRSLTPSSQALVKRRLEQIAAELDDLSEVDTAAARKQTQATAFMVALGPFPVSAITALKPRRGA
jgi:hypothetical protein